MTNSCPSSERLIEFAKGNADDFSAEMIAAHLAGCPQCSTIVNSLAQAAGIPSQSARQQPAQQQAAPKPKKPKQRQKKRQPVEPTPPPAAAASKLPWLVSGLAVAAAVVAIAGTNLGWFSGPAETPDVVESIDETPNGTVENPNTSIVENSDVEPMPGTPPVAGSDAPAVVASEESPAERVGFQMGTLQPNDPIQSLKVKLKVGENGEALMEGVDLHLGFGFPLRLYPIGTDSREPSFAAFPQKSSLEPGNNVLNPGESATFEYAVAPESPGLDELKTTPTLLDGLKVSDIHNIGFASKGSSDWVLEGYEIEVNGQRYASNDSVDKQVGEVQKANQAEVQKLLPAHEVLTEEIKELQAYIDTGFATAADEEQLEAKTKELNSSVAPLAELAGRVTGSYPWFHEDHAEFVPSKEEGPLAEEVIVTLMAGGDEQPGTLNPLYLRVGGQKHLLTSEDDFLVDTPGEQSFRFAGADLEEAPISVAALSDIGLGVVGNDRRFDEIPDRAKLQRVIVKANGQSVYDSEEQPGDRRTLDSIWLIPPGHRDGLGQPVFNEPTDFLVHQWHPGMTVGSPVAFNEFPIGADVPIVNPEFGDPNFGTGNGNANSGAGNRAGGGTGTGGRAGNGTGGRTGNRNTAAGRAGNGNGTGANNSSQGGGSVAGLRVPPVVTPEPDALVTPTNPFVREELALRQGNLQLEQDKLQLERDKLALERQRMLQNLYSSTNPFSGSRRFNSNTGRTGSGGQTQPVSYTINFPNPVNPTPVNVTNSIQPIPSPNVNNASVRNVNILEPGLHQHGDKLTVQWNVDGDTSKIAKFRVRMQVISPHLGALGRIHGYIAEGTRTESRLTTGSQRRLTLPPLNLSNNTNLMGLSGNALMHCYMQPQIQALDSNNNLVSTTPTVPGPLYPVFQKRPGTYGPTPIILELGPSRHSGNTYDANRNLSGNGILSSNINGIPNSKVPGFQIAGDGYGLYRGAPPFFPATDRWLSPTAISLQTGMPQHGTSSNNQGREAWYLHGKNMLGKSTVNSHSFEFSKYPTSLGVSAWPSQVTPSPGGHLNEDSKHITVMYQCAKSFRKPYNPLTDLHFVAHAGFVNIDNLVASSSSTAKINVRVSVIDTITPNFDFSNNTNLPNVTYRYMPTKSEITSQPYEDSEILRISRSVPIRLNKAAMINSLELIDIPILLCDRDLTRYDNFVDKFNQPYGFDFDTAAQSTQDALDNKTETLKNLAVASTKWDTGSPISLTFRITLMIEQDSNNEAIGIFCPRLVPKP